MRFISVRDLRNTPSDVWDALEQEDLVLTANGKPKAVLVRVDNDDLGRTLEALARARTQAAVSRLRAQAVQSGADQLGVEEINKEIAAARKGRKAS